MKKLKCFGVSEGYGIGKALVLKKDYSLNEKSLDGVEVEIEKYNRALLKSIEEIELTIEKSPTSSDIMQAHIMLLEDIEFKNNILDAIREGFSAEFSVHKTSEIFQAMFASIEDDYLRERASDIKDISERLINNIIGRENKIDIKEDFIIVADDLLPSETANLDKKFVKAIVTHIGGRTSHTAILANIMGIAAVTEFEDIDLIKDNDIIIVDGLNGELIINPSEEIISEYREKIEKRKIEKEHLNEYKNMKSQTLDGKDIGTFINIGSPEDMDMFESSGAEGVGLFRTEFIYMQSSKEPSVDKQYELYKDVIIKADSRPVIFRTLDIGGDKEIPYMNFPKEMNPFLGFRAIRYCLKNQNIFRNQIKAILKASAFGQAWIMIPMISIIDEIIEVKAIIKDVEKELLEEKIEFGDFKLGIMIETPSAALMSDQLSKEVDFFSIGTNDLTQYTLACDRMNNSLKDLYSYFDPSVIRLIYRTIKSAKDGKIHVGMCGEAAADELLIPLLILMGIDELSMSPRKVLNAKKVISKFDSSLKNQLIDDVLNSRNKEDVIEKLKKFKENM